MIQTRAGLRVFSIANLVFLLKLSFAFPSP